ncbi:MAG: LptE family protein [Bacteroidales bacterium]
MKLFKTYSVYVISFVVILVLSGCLSGGYSFTGASIGEAKTIRVKHFPNRAPVVQPTLSNTFTEALKDRFVQQTNLNMVNQMADMEFEGEITDYKITPQAYQGNETAALNRLTITVKVKFVNRTDETQNFEQTFSEFADYSSSKSLTSVETVLIEEIVDKLTESIFNKAVVNW